MWAGLHAAAQFAETFGDDVRQATYEKAKDEIRDAALKYLYDDERGRFVRRINVDPKTGTIDVDLTLDSSLYGLFYFGMFDPNDPKDRGDHAASGRSIVGQDRSGRRRALRERLLPSGEPGHRQRSRQPVDHLHTVAGAVAHREGAAARKNCTPLWTYCNGYSGG